MVEILHVLMNGRQIGDLQGTGKKLRLLYNRATVEDPEAVPLSLSMPTSSPRWRGEAISGWISALFPDREGVLARWRRDFGVTDIHDESLLPYVGEDLAGAAQFVTDDRLSGILHNDGGSLPKTDEDVAQMLRAAKADLSPFDFATGAGRFSLAGAQAKIALRKSVDGWELPYGSEPTTHILKPAIPGLESQDLVEVITSQTAALLGLPTASTSIGEFADQRAVISERFDRALVGNRWVRIHQEDLCQALGVNPRLKYESEGGPNARVCANMIRDNCGEKDVVTFARALIFNHLTRGSDAHARNYSVLLTPGEARLAPLYDLNSTLAYGQQWARRLSMSIGGEDRFDYVEYSHWLSLAQAIHLEPEWIISEVMDMARCLPDAMAEVRAQSDVAPFTDTISSALQDNVSAWCVVTTNRVGRA